MNPHQTSLLFNICNGNLLCKCTYHNHISSYIVFYCRYDNISALNFVLSFILPIKTEIERIAGLHYFHGPKCIRSVYTTMHDTLLICTCQQSFSDIQDKHAFNLLVFINIKKKTYISNILDSFQGKSFCDK